MLQVGTLMEVPLVRLAPLVLALAVLLPSAPARACSCLAYGTTLERCRSASWVYAGTVESYDWPLGYRGRADRSVEIRLAVDTVWRGAVPARLVVETDPLGGAGSCTRYPPPGQRFLVCDHKGGEAPSSMGICAPVALGGHAEELIAALGPGAAPQTPGAARWPWWADRARLVDSWNGLMSIFMPFVAALVGAGAGALLHRWRPSPTRRSTRRFVALSLAVALVIVIARVVLHRWLPHERSLFLCVTLGPPVVAGAFGLVLAFYELRRGRGLGGLAIAWVGVLVALIAGFMRLHLPVQPADVVACSEPRAREHVDAYPRRTEDRARDRAALDAWLRGAPAGCADFGLSRMRTDVRGPSVSFPDGRGGEYTMWALEPREYSYRWELP